MEDIIRFMVLRTADSSATRPHATTIDETTALHGRLQALGASATAATAQRLLSDFTDGKSFVDSLDRLRHGKQLKAAAQALRRNDVLNAANIGPILARTLPEPTQALVGSAPWKEDRGRLSDSLLALRYLPNQAVRPIAELGTGLRLMRLVELLAGDDALTDAAVRTVMTGPLIYAGADRLGRILRNPGPDKTTPAKQPSTPRPAAKLKNADITHAMRELGALPASGMEVRSSKKPLVGKGVKAVTSKATPLIQLQGAQAQQAQIHLTSATAKALSPTTLNVLKVLSIDPGKMPVQELVREIPARRSVALFQTVAGSGYFIDTGAAQLLGQNSIAGSLYLPGIVYQFYPTPAVVPSSHGTIRSVGVGDLLVVKQELIGYEMSDISHVENVMTGESKLREHRRRRSVEDFVLREKTTESEEERDIQSTDRYELSTEAQNSLSEQFEINAGIRVNARYGPMVEIEASAEGGYSSSRESMHRTATEVSKEVIDHAVSRIRESVREVRSTKIIDEVEEINRHSLDNSGGGEHVIGVYQWLEKVYRAQIYQYDGRMIYDFNVAEPGAYLDAALRKNVAQEDGLQEPPPFVNMAGEPLSVADINEADYRIYAARFEAAASVEPAPEPFVVLSESFTFEAGAGGSASDIAKSKKLAIPADYEAFHTSVLGLHNGMNAFVTVANELFVNQGSLILDNRLIATLSQAYTGTLEIGLLSQAPTVLLATVHLLCRLSPHATEAWRLRTYAALQEAHGRMTNRYNEALAARAVQNGLAGNAAKMNLNKPLVVRELKKACITLLTHQHYDLFNAITHDALGNPQMNLAVAEKQAAYARFFEQAFEWENINYVFYPYYWGRKSKWLDRLLFVNPNPEIVELIQAGAARVVVAVRPGFEAAVRHFMDTGEVIALDNAAHLGDDDYFDIAEEVRARTDAAAGSPEPVGEPWTIKVPTSLVHLRRERDLPRWGDGS